MRSTTFCTIIRATIIAHYLCHFTVLPPERTMEMMAKDKILIAQQPNFTYNLEGRYVETLEGNASTPTTP